MHFLLDVNLFVALVLPAHEFHEAAHRWFHKDPNRIWSTCPLTQAGFLRIASRSLGASRNGIRLAFASLEKCCLSPNHQYWPLDIDLRDLSGAQQQHILGPNQVTDMQLLLLAHGHGGQLATFDKGIRKLATGTRYANSYCLL